MLRLYKLKVPAHKMGKSFRYDFPIAGNGNMVVGAFAKFRDGSICDNLSDCVKLSVSTDGRIVIPSVRVIYTPSLRATANNMVVPVDFEKMGNKITFVVEEFVSPAQVVDRRMENAEYQIDVYVKSKEK